MKMTKTLMIFGIILSTVIPVSADTYAPSHSCSKPYKPFEFGSEWELDNFNDEVQSFKRCIADFVDEQNEAVETHQQAASEAIDEWNYFVNYELN